MPLSTITATLDNTIRCTINEFCSQQTNATSATDASISFTTLLTAISTLLATIYAAASSSLTLSYIKLYSFHGKQRLLNNFQLMQSNLEINSTYDQRTVNTSPTQSEIVSITGALIVFTVLLSTVLLTHLFNAIDDFTRKCCKIKLSNLVQIGLGKNIRQLLSTINQLILDLIITLVLKSTLLTSLFIDEKSLKLNKKKLINYEDLVNLNFNEEDIRQLEDEQQLNIDEDRQFFSNKKKWSSWFAGQLRKRLVH